MSTSARRVESFFFSEGGLEGTKPSSPLSAVAAGLSHGLPMHDKLITLIDTTTLLNSVSLVEDSIPVKKLPDTLFDLATLIYSCVMYDFVVVGDKTDLVPAELNSFVLPKDTHPGALDERHGFSIDAANASQTYPPSLSELNDAWSQFLSTEVHLDYGCIDRTTSSPGNWNFWPGEYRSSDPIQCLVHNDLNLLSLNESVSIQTWRYFVNEKLAETLGVAYNCTSFRYPVARVALQKRLQYRQWADDFINRLDGQPKVTDWNSNQPYLPRIFLPDPLAMVLKRAKRPLDIWSQVLELREQFRVVRERMQRARIEGTSDHRVVDELIQAANAIDAPTRIDGVIAITSSIAGAIPGAPEFAKVALMIASIIPWFQKTKQALRWMTRPEACVIRSFKKEAAQIAEGTSDIQKIWKIPLDQAWFSRAARISEIDPLASSKLHFRA